MKRYFGLFSCLILLYTTVFTAAVRADDPVTVKVGVYENSPKIFTDEDGNVSGFWPDIIEYIAEEEGWNIEYVHGTWAQCLHMLEENDIDLMPDVAYSEERNGQFEFSNEIVYTSWSRVYVGERSDVQSILDLEGKSIAVLHDSINFKGPDGIKEVTEGFDIKPTFIELDSYTEVFELINKGGVDAGIANRDFYYQNKDNYDITQTPIVFQPSSLYFAFPKTSSLTPYLIERIDQHIVELKAKGNSVYYQSLESWLGITSVEKPVMPDWAMWVLIGFGVMAISLASGSYVLRLQVKAKPSLTRSAVLPGPVVGRWT